MNKKTIVLSLAVAAMLASPLMAVNAQTAAPSSRVQTANSTDYSASFLDKLAAVLGITRTKLDSSVTSAQSATVDQMFKDGVISQNRATQMKQDDAIGRFGMFGRGPSRGEHGFGRGPSRGEHGFGRGLGQALEQGLLDAAAKTLKLSSAALETQLHSGQTLTQIAATQKVDVQTVKDTISSALKTQLAAEVSAGRLTQAQSDAALAQVQADPNLGLGRGRGFGGRGFDGRGFGGQGQSAPAQTPPLR